MSAQTPQRQRISNVLLVGTLYDGYLMEEAGFRPRGQPAPEEAPLFELARTADEAVEAVRREAFDLIVVSGQLRELTGFEVRRRIKEAAPGARVVIVTSDNQLRGEARDPGLAPDPTGIFVWYGAPSALRTIVRLQEDESNAEAVLGSKEGLAILIVEDEPNFYSHYVPAVYERILDATLSILPGVARCDSVWFDVPRRPLVLLRHDFEGAYSLVSRYPWQILALITDIEFPVAGVLRPDAGLKLLYRTRLLQAHMPVVVQSQDKGLRAAVEEAGAHFILKTSNHLLKDLCEFLTNYCGFGPFVFRWPAGVEFGRATTLAELGDILRRVPDVVFEHHAMHNDFSTWLAVHGYGDVARRVREIHITEGDVRGRILEAIDKALRGEEEG